MKKTYEKPTFTKTIYISADNIAARWDEYEDVRPKVNDTDEYCLCTECICDPCGPS